MPHEFPQLQRNRASDQVANSIREAISEGTFAYGARLPSENQLASSFGTSRSTVREALRALETMGYVEIRTGNGAFVADSPFTADALADRLRWLVDRREDVLNILQVREALQSLAAGLCARTATEEQCAALSSVLERMRGAVEQNDVEKFVEADAALHLMIGDQCGNDMLRDVIRYVEETYRTSNRALLYLRSHRGRLLHEHDAIVEAIAARDEAGAETAMHEHIRSVRQAIVDYDTETDA